MFNESGPELDSQPRLLGESRFLVSGSADNMMKLWEVKTGKCLYTWEFPTAIKRVAFSDDDNLIACITEQRMGYQGAIRIFQINRKGDGKDQSNEPISMFHPIESKATVLSFSGSPDQLVTGHESGKLTLYNTKTGDEIVSNKRAHREVVTDIQMSPDRSYFITSSKDKSAKVRVTWNDIRYVNVWI
jgi:translation initiation factor 3 subunit I